MGLILSEEEAVNISLQKNVGLFGDYVIGVDGV
jgi:hypothetical protein